MPDGLKKILQLHWEPMHQKLTFWTARTNLLIEHNMNINVEVTSVDNLSKKLTQTVLY